ncbi:MAG: response regulator [Anaerolineae bacterium]
MSQNNILVVHSESSASNSIFKGIQELGNDYKVESIQTGSEALSKVQQGEFDLLIASCFLPDMTGVNLARSICNISPKTKLFLTVSSKSQALADSMVSEDIDFILDEPLSIAHLQYLVKKTCKEAAKCKKQTFEMSKTLDITPELDLMMPTETMIQSPRQAPESLSMSVSPNPACQTAEIFEELQTLRDNTNSRCVLLLSSSGHIIEHVGSTSQLDIDSISALVAANFMATTELARLVGNKAIFKSTYHAGLDYDIFSCGINEEFLLVNIFGTNTKIGLVRFYVNQSVEKLASMVGHNLFSVDFSDSQIEARVQDELDLLFMA